MISRKARLIRGTLKVLILLSGAFFFLMGCGDDEDGGADNGQDNLSPTRAVVVNGISSSMAIVEFSEPPQVTDNVGGIQLGPSANRVALWGEEAYVVNSGTFGDAENASIQVIDMASASVVRTIPLPDGNSPWDIAILSPNKAYVTNLYGDSVTVLDPRGVDWPSAFIKTIDLPAGSAPAGIVVHGERAYTANTGLDSVTYMYGPATVSVIDTATDTIVDADNDAGNGDDTPISISGINPQDLAVDGGANLWVVCTGDWFSTFGVVDVINTVALSEEESLSIGGSPGSISVGKDVALLGDGGSASLFVVDIEMRTVLRDETNPFVLTTTENSFVPDIVFNHSGEVAYALAFTDDKVFDLLVTDNEVSIRAQYALPAGSGPAGLTLSYE